MCVHTHEQLLNWQKGEPRDGNSAPAAFACPGTPAAAYKACAGATAAGAQGLCAALSPGCSFSARLKACIPASIAGMQPERANATIRELHSLAPAAWGSCAGACYVRQVCGVCTALHERGRSLPRNMICTLDSTLMSDDRHQANQNNDTACSPHTWSSSCLLSVTANKITRRHASASSEETALLLRANPASTASGSVTPMKASRDVRTGKMRRWASMRSRVLMQLHATHALLCRIRRPVKRLHA